MTSEIYAVPIPKYQDGKNKEFHLLKLLSNRIKETFDSIDYRQHEIPLKLKSKLLNNFFRIKIYGSIRNLFTTIFF